MKNIKIYIIILFILSLSMVLGCSPNQVNGDEDEIFIHPLDHKNADTLFVVYMASRNDMMYFTEDGNPLRDDIQEIESSISELRNFGCDLVFYVATYRSISEGSPEWAHQLACIV